LYWFSQTIGPRRGLEEVVAAMGLAGVAGELHLRGRPIPEFRKALDERAASDAPRLKIVYHDPAPPDAMVDLAAPYDVGLATEPGLSENNRLALSNKAFTYMLAGLALVVSDTPGQRPIADDLANSALVFPPGDAEGLARGLRRWVDSPALLSAAKAASWQAAVRRWHWDHPLERGALLDSVARVFQ
jgi:glycosyltransferase involved in cell wall biosynthesis